MRLRDGLKKIADEELISFHMPGHKGRQVLDHLENRFDLTEIEGADDLHHAEGIILATEKLAARYFSSRRAKLSINGSTSGIQAMILGNTRRGDRILVNRNAHKSIYNAMILQDLMPTYIVPRIHSEWGIPLGVDSDQMQGLLTKEAFSCAVLTTPAYEGAVTDLSPLAESRVPLLVDAAHGAHLPLFQGAPPKADATVESLHKTTPAMTQTAILNIRSERLDEDRMDYYLSALMTSSPSYLLMASIDLALERLITTGPEEMKVLITEIEAFEKRIADTRFEVLRFQGQDPTKILLSGLHLGIDGLTLQSKLRQEHRIAVEYARRDYCLLMTSIANTREDFMALSEALARIDADADGQALVHGNVMNPLTPPEIVASPREAFDHLKRTCDLHDAVGTIAAEFITPYPPGIPLVAPGERITVEMVDQIQSMKEHNMQIVGTKDHSLRTLQVLR